MAKKRSRPATKAEGKLYDKYNDLVEGHGIEARTKADWIKMYQARQAEIKANKPKPKRKRARAKASK